MPGNGEESTITLRSLVWPDDRTNLAAIDTSFTSDRQYRLEQNGFCQELQDSPAVPAISNSYSMNAVIDDLPNYEWAQVAEVNGKAIGVAAIVIHPWNNRAELRHLYVSRESRGKGVGRSLVMAAAAAARSRNARCLWVETQTVNYGAICFYMSCRFTWCGLDTSLYDPTNVSNDQIALFFSRNL